MMKTFKIFLTGLIILGLSHINISLAQQLSPGPQVLSFLSSVDDTDQPYGLYIPENYDASKKYPLVIMLHGAGSNHRLALRRVFGKSNHNGETDVEATRYFPDWKPVDYIVASPLARGTMGYQGVAEQDVYDVLADVENRFNIDKDRVYLTGLSMGGGGTLWIGLTRPDIWAAIAPVCPAPPAGTIDLAGNALNYPVIFFQGGADPVVKPEGTRKFSDRMKELGVSVEYNEVPGVQHNVWENAYQDEFIFDWFKKFTRNSSPERVFFSARQLKYGRAYWVTLNSIEPGKVAAIDAAFTGPNMLKITTSNLTSFTLNPENHQKFDPGKSVQFNIDGTVLKEKVNGPVTFNFMNGKWSSGNYAPGPIAKKAGQEGPLADAFTARHIYVYGTADNPSREEQTKRTETALQASNWSGYRGEFLGHIMVFPRTISDKNVRPSDLVSANLVLFGNKNTNSIIDKYSGKLPLALDPDSTDYGLVYIYPVDGHYFVVNSGLPWWTGYKSPGGFSFVQPSLSVIPGLKDFILFKGSVSNVIAEGYFDTNWDLNDKDKQALINSGVILFTQ